MDRKEIVLKYLECFCKPDVASLENLLSPDFQLIGPLFQFSSSQSYISALKQDPPEKSKFNVQQIYENDQGVCVVYEYVKSKDSMLIAQTFQFQDNKISSTLLIFDGRVNS